MAAFASKLMEKVVRAAWRGGLKGVALGDAVPQTPWDLSLWACSSKGVEEKGRAVSGPPHLAVCKPPDRRSGRFPALPYPPLGQKECFPFPFPWGAIGWETGNGSFS